MDTERALLSQMRELEPDVCAEYLVCARNHPEPTTACSSSPLPHDNEVTLLAVIEMSTAWALARCCFDAAVSYLSSRGATKGRTCTPTPTARGSSTSCTA